MTTYSDDSPPPAPPPCGPPDEGDTDFLGFATMAVSDEDAKSAAEAAQMLRESVVAPQMRSSIPGGPATRQQGRGTPTSLAADFSPVTQSELGSAVKEPLPAHSLAAGEQLLCSLMTTVSKMQPYVNRQPRTADEHAALPDDVREALEVKRGDGKDKFQHSMHEPFAAPRPDTTWRQEGGGFFGAVGHGAKQVLKAAYEPCLFFACNHEYVPVLRSFPAARCAIDDVESVLYKDSLQRVFHALLLRSDKHFPQNGGCPHPEDIIATKAQNMVSLLFTQRHAYAWRVKDNDHGSAEWSPFKRAEDAHTADGRGPGSGSGVVDGNPIPLMEFNVLKHGSAPVSLAAIQASEERLAAALADGATLIIYSHYREDLDVSIAQELRELPDGDGLISAVASRVQADADLLAQLQSERECGVTWTPASGEPRRCTLYRNASGLCSNHGTRNLVERAALNSGHLADLNSGRASNLLEHHTAHLAEQQERASASAAAASAAGINIAHRFGSAWQPLLETYVDLRSQGSKEARKKWDATLNGAVPSFMDLSGEITALTKTNAKKPPHLERLRAAYQQTGVEQALNLALRSLWEVQQREGTWQDAQMWKTSDSRDCAKTRIPLWHAVALALALAKHGVSPEQAAGMETE